MIKYMALFFIVFLGRLSVAMTVVTDYDDTLKLTQVHNKALTVKNAFFSDRLMLGMPELLKTYKKSEHYQAKIVIVSASPSFLRKKIEDTLRINNVTYDELHLLGDTDKKYSFLHRYIKQNLDQYILIGDDQDSDHIVYPQLKVDFESEVERIYIRNIQNKKYSEYIVPYFSSFEIVLNEHQNSFFSEDEVQTFLHLVNESLPASERKDGSFEIQNTRGVTVKEENCRDQKWPDPYLKTKVEYLLRLECPAL